MTKTLKVKENRTTLSARIRPESLDRKATLQKFMEKHGVELYHKLNNTKFRNFENFEQTPIQGESATSLWESADTGFEMDIEVQMKKISEWNIDLNEASEAGETKPKPLVLCKWISF